MAARVAVRRPTESSIALSTTKERSLSSVTLTKKTNSLAFDVEELKTNLKELQDQQREHAVLERAESDKLAQVCDTVAILQDAFNSLSDVMVLEIESLQKHIETHVTGLQTQIDTLDKKLIQLQHQTARIDGKRHQFQDQQEKQTTTMQDTISKLTVSLYETQADLGMMKNNTDQLLTREQETTRMVQTLTSSQDQASEWLQKLRHELSILQTDVYTLREEANGSSVAFASDIASLIKETTVLRTNMTQQYAQWNTKLENLRETIDRQSKMDKTQLSQRLDALSEMLATYELRSKESVNGLLKNTSRIRIAVDEGMNICSNEIKTLNHEFKTIWEEYETKLNAVNDQLTTHTVECSKQLDDYRDLCKKNHNA